MSRLISTVAAAVLSATFSFAALAQTPPAPTPPATTPPAGAQPAPAVPADPFGAEVTLTPKTFIYMKGTATWEKAFETLVEAFKTINGYLEKQKIAASDKPLAIYTQTDETGFHYQVGIPIAEAPKKSAEGRPRRGEDARRQDAAIRASRIIRRDGHDL
jgi:hypothetical protein